MTGIRKIVRTRLCPGCGIIARVGEECPACGELVPSGFDPPSPPVVMVACGRCGQRVMAGVRCPGCGEVTE